MEATPTSQADPQPMPDLRELGWGTAPGMLSAASHSGFMRSSSGNPQGSA